MSAELQGRSVQPPPLLSLPSGRCRGRPSGGPGPEGWLSLPPGWCDYSAWLDADGGPVCLPPRVLAWYRRDRCRARGGGLVPVSRLLAPSIYPAGSRVKGVARHAVVVSGGAWHGFSAQCWWGLTRGTVEGSDGALPRQDQVVGGGSGEQCIPVGAPLHALTGAAVGAPVPMFGVSAGGNIAVVTLLLIPAPKNAHPWHWIGVGRPCPGSGGGGEGLVLALCMLSWLRLGSPVRGRCRALEGGLVHALRSLTVVPHLKLA